MNTSTSNHDKKFAKPRINQKILKMFSGRFPTRSAKSQKVLGANEITVQNNYSRHSLPSRKSSSLLATKEHEKNDACFWHCFSSFFLNNSHVRSAGSLYLLRRKSRVTDIINETMTHTKKYALLFQIKRDDDRLNESISIEIVTIYQ